MTAENKELRSGIVVGFLTMNMYSYRGERHKTMAQVRAHLRELGDDDAIQIGALLQLTSGEEASYFPGFNMLPPDLGTRMYEMTCEYCGESCGWSSVENAKGVCGPCSKGLWIDPYFS